jgi:hypothetical protein
MGNHLVRQPDLEGTTSLTLFIGLSCRTPRGFFFMWTRIVSFIMATRTSEGCHLVLAGIGSPFRIQLVSYWRDEEAMTAFVRSRAHVTWMRFIYKHPDSLNLFNETYKKPCRANYINRPGGVAAISGAHHD